MRTESNRSVIQHSQQSQSFNTSLAAFLIMGVLHTVAHAAETPEDCARYSGTDQETCLIRYVDSLERGAIQGCAMGRAAARRLPGEDRIAAEQRTLPQCENDLAEELKAKRPETMKQARDRLLTAVERRQQDLARGERMGKCAESAGIELSKSDATLTEIGEIALVRCSQGLIELFRLDAWKSSREARLDAENSLRRRAMDAAVRARPKK